MPGVAAGLDVVRPGVDVTYRAAGVDVAVVEQRGRGSFELGHTATESCWVHSLLLVPLDRLTTQAETRSSRLKPGSNG